MFTELELHSVTCSFFSITYLILNFGDLLLKIFDELKTTLIVLKTMNILIYKKDFYSTTALVFIVLSVRNYFTIRTIVGKV